MNKPTGIVVPSTDREVISALINDYAFTIESIAIKVKTSVRSIYRVLAGESLAPNTQMRVLSLLIQMKLQG